MIDWAVRSLQAPSGPQGYNFVYLSTPKRTPPSQIRKIMTIFGVNTKRIIDIHTPTRGVIGLLIHQSFHDELITTLATKNITPLDFDPSAATVIVDTMYDDYNDAEKSDKALQIHHQRISRICHRLDNKHLGNAIMHYFHNTDGTHRITDNIYRDHFNNDKKTTSDTQYSEFDMDETYLLQDRLQYHNYAKQHPNAHRGHGGLSILIRPDFPHHVHHQPNTNDYTITITIDKYTIHGLYLPPQLDLTEFNTILQQIPTTDTTIILGDLNTRLGATIGDTRTNSRKHTFEEWQITNSITNWNQTYAFGQPTYRSNIGTSIIDFFLSPTGPTYANEVTIHDQESFNSDHHLCEATFQLDHDIPILSPPTACRKQWKMQRLHELYVSTFNEASVPILQRLKSLVDSTPSTTYTCAQAQRDIDDIATDITNTIYSALDDSATPSIGNGSGQRPSKILQPNANNAIPNGAPSPIHSDNMPPGPTTSKQRMISTTPSNLPAPNNGANLLTSSRHPQVMNYTNI
ncbi:unnamed protein product [Absidia cylindrospora]